MGGCLEPAMNDLNTSIIPAAISRRDKGVTVNTGLRLLSPNKPIVDSED